MNYGDLKTEVELLVDPERTEVISMIPDLINDAVRQIANEPGVILPSLKTITSVDTELSQAYTTLPTDTYSFNGKLLFGSVGGCKVPAFNTLEDLLEAYPDLSDEGSVEGLALEGSTLWYVRVPSEATSIMLLLYRDPATLADNSDIPTEIPAYLHRQTIIPYAAAQLFNMIEQDIEGTKPNTMVQELNYAKGIIKLREHLATRRRGMSRSIWNV